MILVTGATGQLGTAVIQNLLKKTSANRIAALVRDQSKASGLKEKGVDIRVGNYDDTASLDKAMQGIETVLLIKLKQALACFSCATRTAVKRLTTNWTSGSLLIMLPGSQEDWVYAVPKTGPVGERINWTFRPHVEASRNSEQKPA